MFKQKQKYFQLYIFVVFFFLKNTRVVYVKTYEKRKRRKCFKAFLMNKKYTVSIVLECFITVLFTECKYKDEYSSIQTIKLMKCVRV